MRQVVAVLLLALCLTAGAVSASPMNSFGYTDQKLHDMLFGVGPGGMADEKNCNLCKALIPALEPILAKNSSVVVVEAIAKEICLMKNAAGECHGKEECEDVCSGIVATYGNQVIVILERLMTKDPTLLCAALKMCPAPGPTPPPPHEIPVRSNLSDFAGQVQWKSWGLHGEGTFLQLSDIHLDLKYAAGSNSQCGEPLCCRTANGPGHDQHDTAGVWGAYPCDVPVALVENMFQWLTSSAFQPKPDFILFTGDQPPHDVWEQSREDNLAAISTLNGLFRKYFPDTPVFSAVGNHESWPVNQYEGPGYDSWLYEPLADDWAHWLPDDAVRTLRYAGYYQALARPGLRVIALNTNYYPNLNFWLLANDTDYSHQLDWLEDVLQQCRARGEKAILIGHAISADWAEKFAVRMGDLLGAFRDVVVDQYYGHAHVSSYSVYHQNATDIHSPATSTAYIVGSVTTFSNLNPGVRAYHYQRDIASDLSFLATDYDQYWLDLKAANAAGSTPPATWGDVRFSAKKYFGMPDLSPASWDHLGKQMALGGDAYTHFMNGYTRGMTHVHSLPAPVRISCDVQTQDAATYQQCINKLLRQRQASGTHLTSQSAQIRERVQAGDWARAVHRFAATGEIGKLGRPESHC